MKKAHYQPKICEKCKLLFTPNSGMAKICSSCRIYICKFCGKNFTSYRNRKITFCSLDCTNKWQETNKAKEKDRKNTLLKRGSGKIKTCITCNKQFYSPGWYMKKANVKYCSRRCRKLAIEINCPICNKKFTRPPSDIKTSKNNYCSRECATAGILKNRIKNKLIKPTKLEIAGCEILKTITLNFKEQFLINNKFIVDVLVENKNIIIQWDGDFWHSNPKFYDKNNLSKIQQINMKRDKSCNAYLKKCGYKIIRFWEYDVHNNKSYVSSEILKVLESSSKT